MDQPSAHTLSFDDLEVLVLAEALGMDLEEAKALVHDLVRRGWLAGQEQSTAFQLTPMARCLRNDEAFRAAAFAAALTGAAPNDQG